jgi:hypothetical protein
MIVAVTSRRVALIEASGFVITINSIPDRNARKYFTELDMATSRLSHVSAACPIEDSS